MLTNITHYNIYLNNSLLFSTSLSEFTDGTIGFLVKNSGAFYSNLNYSGISILSMPNASNVASLVVYL